MGLKMVKRCVDGDVGEKGNEAGPSRNNMACKILWGHAVARHKNKIASAPHYPFKKHNRDGATVRCHAKYRPFLPIMPSQRASLTFSFAP